MLIPQGKELTQLLVQLVVSGLSQHSLFATLAIKKLCSHSLTLPRATSFFHHLHNADAFHCNTIIRAYTRKPDFPAALCFYYHRMLARSVLPNQCTFPLLIKLCTDIGSLREGLKGMQLDSKDLVRSLIPSYIRDSSVAVIVYDVASRQTFLNTPKWIEGVCSERGSDVIVVLVGIKTDLVDKWPFF